MQNNETTTVVQLQQEYILEPSWKGKKCILHLNEHKIIGKALNEVFDGFVLVQDTIHVFCAVKKLKSKPTGHTLCDESRRLLDLLKLIGEQQFVVQFWAIYVHKDYDLIIMNRMYASVSQVLYNPAFALERARFGLQQRYACMMQILQSVMVLHQNNLAHRDIKSANFLLDANLQRCCLCDFGSVRFGTTTDVDTETTFLGNFGGTVNWMAPERFSAKPLDNYSAMKSDVYSIALVCFELFWNVQPFAYLGADVLQRRHENPYSPPFTDKLQCSIPKFKEYLMSCLAKDIVERPSIYELHKYLTETKFNFDQELKCRLQEFPNQWNYFATTSAPLLQLGGDQILQEKMIQLCKRNKLYAARELAEDILLDHPQSIPAMYVLGKALWHENEPVALENLRRAAQLEYVDAQIFLGYKCSSVEEAEYWLKKASQENDDAVFILVLLYHKLEREQASILSLRKLVAKKYICTCGADILSSFGNSAGQILNDMAYQYDANHEYKPAFHHAQLASNLGQTRSMLLLGKYHSEQILQLDLAEQWLQKALQDYPAEAQYYLAKIYLNQGQMQRSIPLLLQSSELGSALASFSLYRHYEDQQDQENAMRYLKIASKQKLVEAQNKLGIIYFSGKPKNINAALELFQEASIAGHHASMYNLAKMYLTVPSLYNMERAKHWLGRAGERIEKAKQKLLELETQQKQPPPTRSMIVLTKQFSTSTME